MTNGIQRAAPQHGGLIRVALNGGDTVRKQLPFRALSVNIDNWSPYWYKLNPLEVYIPPFQHNMNIALQLLTDFEFVPQAPPGIPQSLFPFPIPTTPPGNSQPLIAVFSSLPTNNDGGFSALENAANAVLPTGVISGATSTDLDLTLFDGAEVYVNAATPLILSFTFINDPGLGSIIAFYTRVMYAGEKLIFTIPKIFRVLRLSLDPDPNNSVTISGGYALRKFIGSLPFTIDQLPSATAAGDQRTVTSGASTTFTTTGVENGIVTVTSLGGAGVTNGTKYSIRVTATGFAFNDIIINKSALINGPDTRLHIPINGLLSRQISSIAVAFQSDVAAASVSIDFHHGLTLDQEYSGYVNPSPITDSNATNLAAAANTLMITMPVAGMFTGLDVVNSFANATAGAVARFYIGTGATPLIALGVIPIGFVGGPYKLNNYRPINMYSGFSTLWGTHNGAGNHTVNWHIAQD